LAKSIGQNGRVGRLSRVANAAITAPFAAIRASRSTSAENERAWTALLLPEARVMGLVPA